MAGSQQVPPPPSVDEQNHYYYGLPSRPKFVARSSTTPWSFQEDNWPIAKVLRPVGSHPIADLWNSAGPLRCDILQALEGVNWTAVDILRIGYERPNDFTREHFEAAVTLFISVKTDSTPWPQAHDVVHRCHGILQRHGIHDVHVEMKEADVFRCAYEDYLDQKVVPGFSKDMGYPALRSEYLGTSICPIHVPREGTKGLYLRDKKSDKTLLLICRHVVFGDAFRNREIRYDPDHYWPVIQPGQTTLHQARAILTGLSQAERDGRVQEQEAVMENFNQAQASLEAIRSPVSRLIGNILYTPPISVGTPGAASPEVGTGFRDWALVELEQEKHESPLSSLQNSVATFGLSLERLKTEVSGWKGVVRHLERDRTFLAVRLKGTIPESELKHPTSETPNGVEALLVAKQGAGSDLTFGAANGVMSVTRTTTHDNVTLITEEWCIPGNMTPGAKNPCFSGPGDSGSCVFDMQGRIGGMITGGNSSLGGVHDVSYATPMEWLFEDIKGHGFDVEIV